MCTQTDIKTAASVPSQSDTSIMTSSSSETSHNTNLHRPVRKETTLWPEVKRYLLSRAESSTDPNTVIPRPMCALCEEEELDIAGIPATDTTSVRFEAAVLPCGHMFCIPCLNEYEDNLPDPNPYDAVYNPVCGRRKLTREYKCPACRADMHHRKCWCEVGACDLPSSDLLDGGVAESGGQWMPKVLHPGERKQEEIEALEWVDHNPAVMDEETRQKLVELVNAVKITMPEWEAAVASEDDGDDDDDDDDGDSDDSDDDDDDDDYPPDIEMDDLTDDEYKLYHAITQHEKMFGKLNTRPVGIDIFDDADLNNKTYPITLWNQVVAPVCQKCDRARLHRFACAMFPGLEILPARFRPRVQKTEEEMYPRVRY